MRGQGVASRPSLLNLDAFETRLGRIAGGWGEDPDGKPMGFHIVELPGSPDSGFATYATLGLSSHWLSDRRGGADRRIEFVVRGFEPDGQRWGPTVLAQIGRRVLDAHEAALRGDLFRPVGPLLPGAMTEAAFCTIPYFLPDPLRPLVTEAGQDEVELLWLAPITTEEARFARSRDWAELETLIEAEPQRLYDVTRRSLVPDFARS